MVRKSPRRPMTCARCGGRLASDNTSGRCAPCQGAERDRLARPPTLPAEFWDHEPIQQALAERHLGRVIRAYRHHPYHGSRPLRQETVGRWLGVSQAQVSRVENGKPIVYLDRLVHWAQILHIPTHLLWFELPTTRNGRSTARVDSAPGQARVAEVLKRQVSQEDNLRLMRSLRMADRRVGGGHLYEMTTAHLAANADPAAVAGISDPVRESLLAATASLNELAGWMAHDAGVDALARKHLGAALTLAKDSGDQQLAAQACASLSHLACYHGNATEAMFYAMAGLTLLQNSAPHGRLKARLLAMQAQGLAIAGRVIESVSALAEAEVSLSQPCDQDSEWLSPFDATSLTIEAARCFLRIGDLSEAQRRLQEVITDQPVERVRSRAFAQLMLATALLAKGQLADACAFTHQAIEQTAGLGSAVIVNQLRRVGVLLNSQSTRSREVPPLLDRLRQTICERSWIGTVGALRAGATDAGQIDGRQPSALRA